MDHGVFFIQYVQGQFKSFGLEAKIEVVNTLLAFPMEEPPKLEILDTNDMSPIFTAGESFSHSPPCLFQMKRIDM